MEELRTIPVLCPYCGETVEIVLEADVTGELVQDCEVCCNPWALQVRRNASGEPSITVGRLDD